MKNVKWFFAEYNDQKVDYPKNPFNEKWFTDFDEMKEYSAKVSSENKSRCIDYCSDYWRYELIDKE